MNLIITVLFSLPILLGVILVVYTKKSKKITEISLAMAFIVLLFLMTFDLVPEILEHTNTFFLFGFGIIGFFLLKGLDHFIPDHHHEENSEHISHIGVMTTVALAIHNFIEGMALYTTLSSDFHLGILIGIGVGLHNIPMGMIIGSTLKVGNNSKLKIVFMSLLTILSTFLGAIVIYFFQNFITDQILGILLSITLGMLVYIVFFELLEHVRHQSKNNNIIGIIIGFVIFVISLFFSH